LDMKNILSNKKLLVSLSAVFVALGVVLAGLGLTYRSETLGAVGIAMFAPAVIGFFRVLVLSSTPNHLENDNE